MPEQCKHYQKHTASCHFGVVKCFESLDRGERDQLKHLFINLRNQEDLIVMLKNARYQEEPRSLGFLTSFASSGFEHV